MTLTTFVSEPTSAASPGDKESSRTRDEFDIVTAIAFQGAAEHCNKLPMRPETGNFGAAGGCADMRRETIMEFPHATPKRVHHGY